MIIFMLKFITVFLINLHGFDMVNTRSSNNKKQEETMATISSEIIETKSLF